MHKDGEIAGLNVVEVERKSRILTKAQFGCLRDTYTLNVTRGCEFLCAYCYARGYPGAPSSDTVELYRNLPKKLARELDSPRRRSEIRWVNFNTASDSFQTHPTILDITYRTMEVLLEREIGFSFLTKGWIPDRFIVLFAEHAELISARIGLVSTSLRYQTLFEPCAATIAERLRNIERLKEAGMEVEVRIDPIIPFYTDDEASIRSLYHALAVRGVKNIALNYLHLRPAILDQLKRELLSTEFGVLRSCFETQPWGTIGTSTRSKLISLPLRRKGYARFKDLSKEFGLKPLICSCKNPDLPAHKCSSGIRIPKTESHQKGGAQLSLFPC